MVRLQPHKPIVPMVILSMLILAACDDNPRTAPATADGPQAALTAVLEHVMANRFERAGIVSHSPNLGQELRTQVLEAATAMDVRFTGERFCYGTATRSGCSSDDQSDLGIRVQAVDRINRTTFHVALQWIGGPWTIEDGSAVLDRGGATFTAEHVGGRWLVEMLPSTLEQIESRLSPQATGGSPSGSSASTNCESYDPR